VAAAAVRAPTDPVRPPDRRPARVLLVDDSAVMRAILARTLAERPGIVVAGQAASAAQAVGCLRAEAVDVVLLDLEMPGVDGLSALPLLLAEGRGARVLVVSSACTAGADATVRALRLGAADTLPKPSNRAEQARFPDLLAERVRRLAAPRTPVCSVRPPTVAPKQPPAAVGIAASTGGVHALGELLAALPADFRSPLLVTQHLPAAFIAFFVRQLAEATGRPARIAETGQVPQPGEILVAPGDAHLTLARTGGLAHVRLDRSPAASGCCPSADPMLSSLAEVHGAAAAGVVLSGMGRDGAAGARALAAAGGAILAQDAATSVVWGMPGTVARAGLAQAVLPPRGIAGVLAEMGRGAAPCR